MVTAAAVPSGAGDRWWSRTRMWFGHYADYLFMLMFVVFAVLIPIRPHGPALVQLLVFDVLPIVVAAAAVVSSAFMAPYHDARLCLRDVRAAPLLDPAGAVVRHRRALAYHHSRFLQKVFVTGTFLMLVIFVTSGGRHWWVQVLYSVSLIVGLSRVYESRVHTKLRPWCPFCRDNGGGWGGEAIPEPSPDPVVKANA